MLVCFTFDRTNETVQLRAGSSIYPTHGERGNGEGENSRAMTQEDLRLTESIPVSRNSVLGRFSAGLFLRGGRQKASATARDPADLEAGLCG